MCFIASALDSRPHLPQGLDPLFRVGFFFQGKNCKFFVYI